MGIAGLGSSPSRVEVAPGRELSWQRPRFKVAKGLTDNLALDAVEACECGADVASKSGEASIGELLLKQTVALQIVDG